MGSSAVGRRQAVEVEAEDEDDDVQDEEEVRRAFLAGLSGVTISVEAGLFVAVLLTSCFCSVVAAAGGACCSSGKTDAVGQTISSWSSNSNVFNDAPTSASLNLSPLLTAASAAAAAAVAAAPSFVIPRKRGVVVI